MSLTDLPAEDAFDAAAESAFAMRVRAIEEKARLVVGGCTRQNMRVMKSNCVVESLTLTEIAAGARLGRTVRGDLNAVARAKYNDPTYNFTAELPVIITELDALATWIHANFPKDREGGFATEGENLDGSPIPINLTGTLATDYETRIDSLITVLQ